MIEIQSLGIKKYASTKSAIGSTAEVNWGEHIFIEKKKLVKNIFY
jgi:hypothetical protein